MNRTWLDKQKSRANKAHFREPGHVNETPEAYYIRKTGLLNLVYSYSDSEIILEVMEGAPLFWSTIIDPHRYQNLVEFASALKYHEDALQRNSAISDRGLERRIRNLELSVRSQGSQYPSRFRGSARSNLIGSSPTMGKPPFPKDDSTISKGITPEKKGVRPCHHCGSGKHWDNNCKFARRGMKLAKANMVNQDPEYVQAMQDYEEAYLNTSSEDDSV